MDITIQRGVFDGLYSYEIVLLLMGVVLFLVGVWALVRKIRSGGSFIAPLTIFPFVLVFVGYPSVQAVKFNNAVTESAQLATLPAGTGMSAEQKKAAEKNIETLAARGKTPQMQTLAANAYRAIGDTGKAYGLAQSVLAKDPPPTIRRALVPVLTARLEQITPANPTVAPPPADRQEEIAAVAKQLQAQAQAAPLPADSHLALAEAYVALGDDQSARSNVEVARRMNPRIVISPALKRVVRPPAAGTH